MSKFVSDLIGVGNKLIFGIGGNLIKSISGGVAIRNGADSADADLTANQIKVSGDSIIINSDGTTGANRKITIQRPTSGMTSDYSLTLPPSGGSAGQVARLSSSGVVVFATPEDYNSQAIASSSSVNIDLSSARAFTLTLNQNTAISAIQNAPTWASCIVFYLKTTQDATGGRSLSFPGGVVITGSINSAANSSSVIKIISFDSGSSWEAIVLKPQSSASNVLWTPANIDTSLWLDATDPSTVFLGTGVSQANDKSGNGRNLSQSTGSQQPSLISNALNGKSVIRFDGSNDFLRATNAFNLGNNVTFFFVFKYSSANQYGLYDSAPGIANSLRNEQSGAVEWWVQDPQVSLSAPSNTWLILTIIYSISSTRKIEKWINDDSANYASATSSSSTSAGWSNFSLGAIDNNQRWFAGDLAELVALNRIVTTDERNKLAGYAANKLGLQSSLPTNHPYKLNPPTV